MKTNAGWSGLERVRTTSTIRYLAEDVPTLVTAPTPFGHARPELRHLLMLSGVDGDADQLDRVVVQEGAERGEGSDEET